MRIFTQLVALILCCSVHLSHAQYYRLEESNALYGLFTEQEIMVESFFRFGVLPSRVTKAENSNLNAVQLAARADRLKDVLTDCFVPFHFESVYAEGSLENGPIESRKTYFYMRADSTIEFLTQTRVLFEGTEVEKEKYAPKVKDIQVRTGKDIIRPDKRTLHKAFYPEPDPELDAIAGIMPEDFPPPEPPPAPPSIVLNDDTRLTPVEIEGELSMEIPEGLRESGNVKIGDKIRVLYSSGVNLQLLIQQLDDKEVAQHLKRNKAAKKLEGVIIHKDEKSKRNQLKINVLEGTYFDKEHAWTKVIVQSKNAAYALTLSYKAEDRIKGKQARQRIIDSIELK